MQWLWRRPAAGAPIPPLGQELPYAIGGHKNKKYGYDTSKITFYLFLPHPQHFEIPRLRIEPIPHIWTRLIRTLTIFFSVQEDYR